MKDVLKALPALLVVCGPPLAAGFWGRRLWGWLWVAGFAVAAATATSREPAGYDMPGFGTRLFGAAAALAALAFAAGGLLRWLRIRRAAA